MEKSNKQPIESTHFESLYPANCREEEISKILSLVKEGNSCQIISFPGVGRGTILRLLSYNRTVRIKHLGENQKWFHFVLVNFSEIRKRPLYDTTKFLFLNLVDSLRERKMNQEYEQTQKIFKNSLSYNDELVLFQGLKQTIDLLAIEKELTIVFLFDSFEEYIPMLTEDFFTNLKVLRSRAKYRFSVVFSLNRPLEELVEPTLFSDFYEFLADNTIVLTILDKPSLDFRISYLEKVSEKTIPQNIKHELIQLTNGHGKLTRVASESFLEYNPQLKNIPQNLQTFLQERKRVQKVCMEIWNSLTPSEQKALINNVILGSEERTTPESLNVRDPGQARLASRAERARMTDNYLQTVGLLKNSHITIPLFEHFVQQEASHQTPSEEHITFDQNTQDIKKGELVLSNSLTSSEFRLLRLCVQNPDRILEREEIINAVWQDAKSTAGVTDQALDQLIFRVRHKIESDPNQPTHLQTIKGRGFRFAP